MQFLLAEESLSMADIAPLFSEMADISLWRFTELACWSRFVPTNALSYTLLPLSLKMGY